MKQILFAVIALLLYACDNKPLDHSENQTKEDTIGIIDHVLKRGNTSIDVYVQVRIILFA